MALRKTILGDYLVDSPSPINLSYFWSFGSLLGFTLIVKEVFYVSLYLPLSRFIIISRDAIYDFTVYFRYLIGLLSYGIAYLCLIYRLALNIGLAAFDSVCHFPFFAMITSLFIPPLIAIRGEFALEISL